MTGKQKLTGRAGSIPGGLVLGSGVSLIITVLIAAISAHMVSTEMIPQKWIGYCAMFALAAASGIGGWAAAAKVKRKPIQVALLNGAVFFSGLLAATALFFGGRYSGMGVTLIVIALGSGAGGMLSQKYWKKNVRKQSRKKHW